MIKLGAKKFKISLLLVAFLLSFEISQAGVIMQATSISTVLHNLLEVLLSIFSIIATISLVVSGIRYFLAAGDVKGQETAKKSFQYSVIGIVVGLSGMLIMNLIASWMQ